jgi:hypothetical protein
LTQCPHTSISADTFQRNLVRNGGFVDEVIFVVRTDDEADLRFLEELVETNENYSIYTSAEGRGVRFADAWNVVNRGKMYIKIDDDVVSATSD